MTKSPPQRRGIRFEVGAQLEARDSLRNWYVANIEKIDYEDEKVLIHYRQWSHRYDEWFDWSSPYLRPMERIQLRKQGLSEPRSAPGFHINQKVLASWSDCRYYPAKILSRDKDGSYTVKFFDGVVKTVKGIKVKPFRKQSSGQTRRRREWNGSGSRHSASDQERETDSEEDEGEISVMDELQAAFPEENSEPSDTTETSAGPDQNHQTIPNGGEKNQKDDAVSQDSPSLPRRTRSRATDGKDPERLIGPELRKRRASTGQTPPSKRSRAGSSTVKSSRSQIKPVKMESVTSESADTPAVTPVTSEEPDLALAVKRQVHLPTTNKYSREPLYRVIKNQPPPILSIELDHNPFKCETPGCPKSFRKASLLHYHMKYYHAQSDPSSAHKPSPPSSAHKPSPETTPRRRRSSPGTKENQHLNRPPHDDRDWVAKETGEAKESERLREKPQRDFLRVKLKKRKKKKSKSGEESSSGLSSDGPLWSEDDSEDELNSERGAESVTHGAEIVRCICEVQEENDFMIQCDECFCWQHGTCMGLYEDSVPDNYSCYVCRDPPAQRPSQRFWFDKDWLSSGHMHGLSFLEENYSHQNSKKVTATHQLLGDVQRVFEVLNGLQLKMSILQTQAHPELKLWRQPWKPTSGLRRRGVATPTPPSPPDTGSDGLEKSAFPSHSYIFSDHCYQKPFTYYPALERRLVVETRGGSELEDSLRTSEDLLEMAEQRYGMMEQEQHKLQLTERSFSKELESRMKCLVSGEKTTCLAEVKQEEPDSKPDPDLLLHQQWQLNLLQHIEAVQDQVTHRMDLIERELDVLESWLDYTGELEPPEPLARLPQLKRRIRQLLADLATVQQMALCSSLPV